MTDPPPLEPIPPLPVGRPVESAVSVDESGVVVVDRSCRQCGYNVRGLHVDRHCPECGTPVAVSARGDALEFCEPGWVKKLSLGGWMLVIGPTLMLLGVIGFLAIVFGILALLGTTSKPMDLLFALVVFAILTGLFGGMLLAYIGTWFLTAREPLAFESREVSNSRAVVRVGLVMAIISPIVQAVATGTTLPRAVEILLILINVPISLFALYAVRQYYLWIGLLARRFPDPQLVSRCRTLGTWVPVGLLPPTLLSMGQTVMEAAGRAGGPATIHSLDSGGAIRPLFAALGCVSCATSLLLLVLMFVAMRAQSRLRTGLREAARRARHNWDTVMGAPRGPVAPGLTSDTTHT